MRNNDEAYTLATYMRDMLHNEPDTEDTKVFIEHESDFRKATFIRMTILIPYKDE